MPGATSRMDRITELRYILGILLGRILTQLEFPNYSTYTLTPILTEGGTMSN